MIETQIGGSPAPGPLDGCPQRTDCELAASSLEKWTIGKDFKQWFQDVQRRIVNGYCPLAGLSCNDRSADRQVNPTTIQGAELARSESSDEEQAQSGADMARTSFHYPPSLYQGDGAPPSHPRLADVGDRVGVEVPL